MEDYYKANAKEYIDSTFSCDMMEQYKFFEKYSKKGSLLDIGCGSGRDSVYFQKQGYIVSSLDPTEEFCEHVKRLGIKDVYQIKAQEMIFDKMFDNIWACASLLHVTYDELSLVLLKCYKALTDNGIMYMSFKYGNFEGERDGKFYCDMTEAKIQKLLKTTPFQLVELTKTKDVKRRNNTTWINIIIRK